MQNLETQGTRGDTEEGKVKGNVKGSGRGRPLHTWVIFFAAGFAEERRLNAKS
jgi:hypothetical protein